MLARAYTNQQLKSFFSFQIASFATRSDPQSLHRSNSFESSLKTSPLRLHRPRISTYLEHVKASLPLKNPEKVHEEALKKLETNNYAQGKKFVENVENQAAWLSTPQSFVCDLKTGEKIDLIDLDPHFFRVEPRKDVLHRAIVWQLAKRRQGTKKTLSRYESFYSKKKMGSQKGSGRARHGDRGAPNIVGGGRAHPIQPKNWEHKLNKKERYLALRMALTLKFRRNELIVVNSLNVGNLKTSFTANILNKNYGVNQYKSALVVDGSDHVDALFEKASWNLNYVDTISYNGLNVYDLLHRDRFIITKEALDKLSEKRKNSSNTLNSKIMTRVG